jgi:hypothetical protein
MIMPTDDPYAFRPEDDCYHQLSDDPYETETNWWSFNIPARKIGCWIHTPYYPNRKTVTWRIFVWDERGFDPARMAYFKKVEEAPMPDHPDLREITFPGGGYSLKMLDPGMRYHSPACIRRAGSSPANRRSSRRPTMTSLAAWWASCGWMGKRSQSTHGACATAPGDRAAGPMRKAGSRAMPPTSIG